MGRVLVLGSYNRDLVLRVPRFPRAGETLHAYGMQQHHGGKGSNQAVAAARAGADVEFLGLLGSDEAGIAAAALWRAERIAADRVAAHESLHTGTALILVDDAGENQIVVLAGANGAVSEVAAASFGASSRAGELAMAQLETPIDATQSFFRGARQSGAVSLLNAAPASPAASALLPETQWLVVNEAEAALLSGETDIGSSGRQLGARVATGVVITCGADGARAFRQGGEVLHQTGAAITPVDTTGAGDAFTGAFAAALAEGRDWPAALAFGVAAGALACTRAGAVPSLPDRAAIAALVASLPPARAG